MAAPQSAETVSDGVELVSSMNSGRNPLLLPANQLAWSWNISLPNDYATCRPGWRHVWTLNEANAAVRRMSPATRDILLHRKFQGAYAYYPNEGLPHLILCVSGAIIAASGDIYGGSPSGWHVRDFGLKFQRYADRIWAVQAEDYLVMQDGSSRPQIYRDGQLRESGFPIIGNHNELTAGRAMSFANGRIWLASANGRDFMAGDITRGPSGNQAFGFRDAVLKKTENAFLAGGGRFAVPFSAGTISAFVQPSQSDVPGNTGPLVALTEQGAFGINLPVERDQWANLRSPPVTVFAAGEGCVGPMAHLVVNGDVLFRSPSGIRSLRRGYRDLASGWSNRILSWELNRVQVQTQEAWLFAASAAYHDYRAFFTERPENLVEWDATGATEGSQRGIGFRWLSSLLISGISTLTEDTAPAWEGIWCGLRIMQLLPVIVNRTPRLFALALTPADRLALYELDHQLTHDIGSDGETYAIQWGIETRSLFTDTRLVPKRLKDLELGLTNIVGPVTVRVLFRTHGAANWQLWDTKSVQAGMCVSSAPDGCVQLGNLAAGILYPMRFGMPGESCDVETNRPNVDGYSYQLRLEISGYCSLSYAFVRAILLPRIEVIECEKTITLPAVGECGSTRPENIHVIP